MVLSVVIATYACRGETLKVTLNRLTKQTLPAADFEVIVVDDGSPDDGTEKVVESLASSMPFKIRYFANSFKGPGSAQNVGIREAEADLVLLLADDIHPTPSMLHEHVAYHRQHTESNIAVLSRVLQSPDLPDSVFLRHWEPFGFSGMDDETELPYWKFWACSISVKRSFLLQNGMYRELQGAAHEDVELGYRLCRKGLRIVYLPRALAYHYHVETLDAACKRAYERGVNWWFIEAHVDDPEIHVFYQLLTRHTIKRYLAVFRRPSAYASLPFAYRFWPWLLFKQVVRWGVFNRFTVPNIWLPFLRAAETNAALAALVTGYFVRGAVFHHFGRGYVESHQRARAWTRSEAGT